MLTGQRPPLAPAPNTPAEPRPVPEAQNRARERYGVRDSRRFEPAFDPAGSSGGGAGPAARSERPALPRQRLERSQQREGRKQPPSGVAQAQVATASRCGIVSHCLRPFNTLGPLELAPPVNGHPERTKPDSNPRVGGGAPRRFPR